MSVLHIIGLLMACIGAATLKRAQMYDMRLGYWEGCAQLAIAVFCMIAAMRINRRRGELLSEKVRATGQLELCIRELEARLTAAELEARGEEAALKDVAACIEPIVAAATAPDVSLSADLPAFQPSYAAPDEELLRLISHEARTPLATIHAYSELLLDGDPLDDATRHDFFAIIHAESERLSLVLDSLLNLARMDAGTLSTHPTPTSLNAVTARIVHGSIALADLRKVTVEVDLVADPDCVCADEELFIQATRNLLTHAVKHTVPGGRIVVKSRTDNANRNVLLEISGNRTGNTPKDMPSALDRVYGGGNSRGRHVPPGAAGLALARRAIESVHGGTTIVTVDGESCTLGFSLPLAGEPGERSESAVPTVEEKDV